MKFHISFLALAKLASARNIYAPHLRNGNNDLVSNGPLDQEKTSELLTKLIERIEYLEMQVEKVENLESRVKELEGTVETIQSSHGRSRYLENLLDEECVIKYSNITGMCHMNHTFAVDQSSEFYGRVRMMDGSDVQGALEVDGPAMLKRGMEVRGGLISVNTTTRLGNLTIDGTQIVGKTTFFDAVEFRDSAHFSGHYVSFNSEATFYEDVCFENDVSFKDDVAILGPTSGDSSESSTDFQVYGYVNVDFKQKKAIDIYPETHFRDDVHLMAGSSTTSSSSASSDSTSTSTTTTTTSTSESDDSSSSTSSITTTSSYTSTSSGSRSSSSDYSSDSHDHLPELKVQGDITAKSDLKVLGDLRVDGGTLLKDDLTISPPATTATTRSGNPALRITRGDLQLNNGDINVNNGNVGIQRVAGYLGNGNGGLNAERISVRNGDVDISNGDLTVSGSGVGDALRVNGNTFLNGNVVVQGTGGVGTRERRAQAGRPDALTVIGSTMLEGTAMSIGEMNFASVTTDSLTVNQDASIGGQVTAASANVAGSVAARQVTSNMVSTGDLEASGNTNLAGNVRVGGNLDANVTVDLESANFDSLTANSLTISGTSNLAQVNAGAVSATDSITTTGSGSFGSVQANTVTATNSITTNGDLTVGGNLDVTGTATIPDLQGVTSLTVNGPSSFQAVDAQSVAAGSLESRGTLQATGNTNLGGNLAVSGSTSLNNGATVTGRTNLNGDVNINNRGDLRIGGDIVGDVNITGSVDIGRNLDVAGTTNVNVQVDLDDVNLDSLTLSSLTVTNNLQAGSANLGDTTITGSGTRPALQVSNGNTVLNNGASVTGGVNTDSLVATGSGSFGTTLQVSGATTLAGMQASSSNLGDTIITGSGTRAALQVANGNTELNNGANVGGSGLRVIGGTNTDSLTATGDGSFGGTLQATGDSNLNGNVAIGGNLDVAGTSNVPVNLDSVTFDTLSANSLSVSNSLIVDGTSNLGQATADSLSAGSLVSTGILQVTGGSTTLGELSADSISTTGSATIGGSVSAGTTLTVGESITADTITTAGDVSVGGNLAVDGTSNIPVDTNSLTFDNIEANSLTINGPVTATSGQFESLSVSGNTDLDGDVGIGQNLNVVGSSTLNGGGSMGDTTINGALTVSGGDVQINQNLQVDGTINGQVFPGP